MPARVFKVQEFRRWAKREGLTDTSLRAAAQEIENGLIDGGLGGVLIKKRVAAAGCGKRGGYGTIAAYQRSNRLAFHGFAKNEKDNISPKEQEALRKLGEHYMSFTDTGMTKLVREGLVTEVET